MCVQKQNFAVKCNNESNNMSRNVNDASHVVAEVISGQGQSRPTKRINNAASIPNESRYGTRAFL